jgi:hypothetical protein
MPRRQVHRSRAKDGALLWIVRRTCSTLALPSVSHRSLTCGARCPQFADVNAFLTFAATQHTYTPEHLQGRPRVAQILEAAKAGHVPVRLVSSTSHVTVGSRTHRPSPHRDTSMTALSPYRSFRQESSR